MLLINSNEGALRNDNTALFGASRISPALIAYRIWAALQGEERPSHMLWLSAILVGLLHIWLLTLLQKPVESLTEAKPLQMEVSMVTISTPKPIVEAPKPLPPPPAPPKINKPKPVIKKPVPVVQKAPPPKVQEAPDFAPFEPFKPAPPQQTPSAATSQSTSSNVNTTSQTTSEAPTFTEANFKANYAHNPKPDYPDIAKSRGWQGKVLLRVKVSAQGLSDEVTVEKSSGREILDDSAIEAVKKWRFIPAKRGDTPVASSVIVPIDFKLR